MDGVDIILDRYYLSAGKNLHYFLENSIARADRIIIIFTPNYRLKADKRSGGVGYEYSIMNSDLYNNQTTNEKIIPILRQGSLNESIPAFMQQYVYINMSNNQDFENCYIELLREIYQEPEILPPQLGNKPLFKNIISDNKIENPIQNKPKEEIEKNLSEEEQNSWQKSIEQNNLRGFANYLEYFPDGQFISEARTKIRNLQDEPDWQTAQRKNTYSSYETYLIYHPDGKHVQEAHLILEELKLISANDAKKHFDRFKELATKFNPSYENENVSSKKEIPPSDLNREIISDDEIKSILFNSSGFMRKINSILFSQSNLPDERLSETIELIKSYLFHNPEGKYRKSAIQRLGDLQRIYFKSIDALTGNNDFLL